MFKKIQLTIDIELTEPCDEDAAWQIVHKLLVEAKHEGEKSRPHFTVIPHTVWFDQNQN